MFRNQETRFNELKFAKQLADARQETMKSSSLLRDALNKRKVHMQLSKKR